MNLLDENIPLDQRDLLRSWGIHCRLIGHDISESSVSDDNIITLLHQLKQPTLFTRDEDFFQRRLCHLGYALIWLDAAPAEAAMFVRRFLRHPRFRTKAQRMGIVVRVHHDGVQFWQRKQAGLQRLTWVEE
ncbi:MAG: hypothetical protein HYY24_05505 [Verrucomicrobia bacterium]|nr:hypothetical protein [Verrucomicrobiota bacterium]